MKQVLKIIVAIWAIVVTAWEVIEFATTFPLEFARFPFLSVLLLIVGIMLLIPSLVKYETILMVIALIIFGFLAISALIAFIKGIGSVEVQDLFVYVFRGVAKVAFIFIPAILSFLFLFSKPQRAK